MINQNIRTYSTGFLILISLISYGQEKIFLTSDFLKGNWCFIDSICDPDENNSGYNYTEIHLNDSMYIYYSAYPGIGPAYYPYEIKDNSIVFKNGRSIPVEIIDSNRISVTFKCWEDKFITHVLDRMQNHKFPLKDFMKDDELDIYEFELRKRQQELLIKKGLVKQ